jgi:hypothetical protein
MSCSNSKTFPADIPHETPSPELALSPSLVPSATPVPSSTRSPTDTPTIAPTSTWTPLPTYSAQDASKKIDELLDTNAGCNLPCWWGITPNQTSWPEALHFLNPLIVYVGQGSSQIYSKDGNQHISTNYSILFEVPEISKQGRIIFGVQDDIVTGMSVFPPVTEYKYQLHELLILLGPPKQVFVNAQSSSQISELPPAVLTLDYSELGIWASYGYIPFVDGESLVICSKSIKESNTVYGGWGNLGGRLELFDPDYEYDTRFSIEEYAEMWGGSTPQKLADVTDMTTETFYNTFIQPGSCLNTPADLWP